MSKFAFSSFNFVNLSSPPEPILDLLTKKESKNIFVPSGRFNLKKDPSSSVQFNKYQEDLSKKQDIKYEEKNIPNILENKDVELLVDQVERCNQILRKLTMNPAIEDDFIDKDLSIAEYVDEIVKSFEEIKKTYENLNKCFLVFNSSTIGFEALARNLKCVSFDKRLNSLDTFKNAFSISLVRMY